MNEKMMEVRFTFISCILITASLIPNMTIAKKTILVFVQEFCYSVLVKYMDPKPNLPPSSFYSSLSHPSLSYHVEHFIFYTRTKKKDEENHSISHRLRKKNSLRQLGSFTSLSLALRPIQAPKVIRNEHALSPETLQAPQIRPG